jgi:hypothetical protein
MQWAKSAGVLVTVIVVLGGICSAVYIEGASLAVLLVSSHGYGAMESARMGACADRLATTLGVVEVAGVVALAGLCWRQWRRALGACFLFAVTQLLLVSSAFLISQDAFVRVVQSAGRLLRGCVCG